MRNGFKSTSGRFRPSNWRCCSRKSASGCRQTCRRLFSKWARPPASCTSCGNAWTSRSSRSVSAADSIPPMFARHCSRSSPVLVMTTRRCSASAWSKSPSKKRESSSRECPWSAGLAALHGRSSPVWRPSAARRWSSWIAIFSSPMSLDWPAAARHAPRSERGSIAGRR